jgi:hypothetical protein
VSTSTTSTPFSTPALFHRVEGHGRRVGALRAPDGLDADAVAPCLQLLGGRGAERVGGSQQDGLALGDQQAGKLAHGRGLAGAVHSDDEHHGGQTVGAESRSRSRGPSWGRPASTSSRRSTARARVGVGDPVDRQLPAEVLDQLGPVGTDAQVGADQGGLEVVPGVGVQLVGADEARATPGLARWWSRTGGGGAVPGACPASSGRLGLDDGRRPGQPSAPGRGRASARPEGVRSRWLAGRGPGG